MTESEEKESLARAHLPYRAEYCATSRARCKKCSNTMEADTLKLAIMTKSRFHDGYDASYHHVECFFQIKRPHSVAEIRYFETLRYEDQKMLEEAIETKGRSVMAASLTDQNGNETSSNGKRSKSSKRMPDDAGLVNYNDFLLEYAKSSRAKCNLCDEKIEKSEVRLGKYDYDAENAWRGGPIARWFHVECFAKSVEQLEFFGSVEKIGTFKDLDEEDQQMLRKKVKPLQVDQKKASGDKREKKKVKKEEQGDSSEPEEKEREKKKESEEDKLLRKQSDRYFALRSFVNSMKRKDIERMLDSMDQKSSFKATSMLVDHATDVLLFGPLAKCPSCKKGKSIILRGGSYICTSGSESDPCNHETRDPKREMPHVPDEIVETYPFFAEKYKFKVGKRLFSSKFIKAVDQKEAEDNNVVQAGAPLDKLALGVISWNSVKTDKTKVQKKITTLGGKLQTSIDKSIFVILSSEDEVNKNSPKVEVAKALGVPFATEDFLFKIETKEGVVQQLSKCLIGDWDGDIQERYNKLTGK